MKKGANIALVTTIPERCRMCFTCVRECPAKAIRIVEGQADVVAERCIGCGNCVRVCSQRAKQVVDGTAAVADLLTSDAPVAAIVAPSFPADFDDCDFHEFVGMVRALGFAYVNEVAFGADLVADRYRDLLEQPDGKRYVATSCPAIVAYVERYHPDLTGSLAPIVSPMIAAARVLKHTHGDDLRIVFIGPCIAKKGEIVSNHLNEEVDEALTFIELRSMIEARGIRPENVKPTDFDPPHGGAGGLFPISRGMLQAGHIAEDLVDGRVVAADGRSQFVEAIKEFEAGNLEAKLLEILACNGCINGPGTRGDNTLFGRRNRVSKYVRNRISRFDWHRWRKQVDRFAKIDLRRSFSPDDQRIPTPSEDELRGILERLGKFCREDELNCGACGYDTCREHAVAIYKGLAENEMCLPHVITQLKKTMVDLATSKGQLEETREALVQSEKLAHMGQLAAGIAHELNNPLGVVLMYAHMLHDENARDQKLQEDLTMITDQADRCKKIVAGLLHFARQNKIDSVPTDVHDLVERAVKSTPPPQGIEVEISHEAEQKEVSLDRDQMLQVLTNLIGNAYGAMPGGGVMRIRTFTTPAQLKISVSDSGTGITKENREKIFEPFFTTKEAGKGTGLGLAVSYGIVKMHRGDIRVESNADPEAGPTGTTFTVALPR